MYKTKDNIIFSIIFLFIGFGVGFFIKDEESIKTQKFYIEKKQINEVKNKKEKIVKIKKIEELPSFIKEDLEYFNIQSSNLDKEQWKAFLDLIKNQEREELNKQNYLKFLEQSIKYGSINKVLDFIEKGGDINKEDNLGNTPLYYAFKFGRGLKLIKALIDNGADLNFNENKYSKEDALELALKSYNPVISGSKDALNFLLEEGFTFKKKHFDLLLKENGDYLFNFLDSLENNSIYSQRVGINHLANVLRNGSKIAIDYMLENKTDLKTIEHKDTLLLGASSSNNISEENFKKILEETKVNVNKPLNITERTALMHAALSGTISNIKVLLDHGADIYATDKIGKDIYHYLKLSHRSKYEKDLIEKLLDKNKEE